MFVALVLLFNADLILGKGPSPFFQGKKSPKFHMGVSSDSTQPNSAMHRLMLYIISKSLLS